MNFKKTFVLLWALVLTLALFSCGEASPLEIADENGEDDYSLAVLPRSKHLLISWLQSPSAVIL